MRFYELIRGILPVQGDDFEVASVTDRSDAVLPGTVFVAVPGRKHDGRDYLSEVYGKGAGAAVVALPDDSVPLLQIPHPDPRRIYSLLAARFFGEPARSLTLVGITGTNGKTSTAYLLRHLFRACGFRCGMTGTVQTDDGDACLPSCATTPDPSRLQEAYARMVRNGCTHAVSEVSSQALDQSRVAGVEFRVGVLTNLTGDHLDYHRTFSAYRNAKLRLFAQSRVRLVNIDSDYTAPFLAYGAYRLSASEKADFYARRIHTGSRGVSYDACTPSGCYPVTLPVCGRFSVYNSLCALACAELAGADPARCAASFPSFSGVPGRLERIFPQLPFSLILDYAHTPDGLENALRSVRGFTRGRVLLVFGCGGDRDREKRAAMGSIAARLADFAVVTTDNPRSEDPASIIGQILAGASPGALLSVPDRTEAIRTALLAARPGDCVLIAGKGHETSQIFSDRTVSYDERIVAREILKEEGLLQ